MFYLFYITPQFIRFCLWQDDVKEWNISEHDTHLPSHLLHSIIIITHMLQNALWGHRHYAFNEHVLNRRLCVVFVSLIIIWVAICSTMFTDVTIQHSVEWISPLCDAATVGGDWFFSGKDSKWSLFKPSTLNKNLGDRKITSGSDYILVVSNMHLFVDSGTTLYDKQIPTLFFFLLVLCAGW